MDTINFEGAKTLYKKEVFRFFKVYNQTLFAPIVTSLLFLAVFNLAMGDRVSHVADVPFVEFMAAGLIMMAMMNNAFANSSSSFIMGKVLGIIIDYLMPPISAAEMVIAVVLAAVTRGICVGILVGISVSFFAPIEIHHIGYVIFFAISACTLLGLLGIFAGVIAETFDQMAAVTNYVITPLSFLSGTFYSVKKLPEIWYSISQFNPFFYMIDGFRYGMTGYHDGNLQVGIVVMLAANLFLFTVVYLLIKKGYRLKQ